MSAPTAQRAVTDLYTRLLRAWNERDAEEYAALFLPGSTMIGFDGSQVNGTQVREHLAPIFKDHPTAAYVAKIREIRPLGPDNVLLRAVVGMVPPGKQQLNPAANAVQTLIAEDREEGWRIVLFQNTPAQYHGRPELTEQHVAELEPLVADGTIIA